MTLFLVFLFSCSLFNKESITDFDSLEFVPVNLIKEHCPSNSKLITEGNLSYCLDKKSNKKNGPSLLIEEDIYVLYFYEQGTIMHFPWIYSKPNAPSWNFF